MIKFLIIVLIIFAAMQLSAQDIVVNTSDGTTSIHILVPFSQYQFSARTASARYQMSINLLDTDKKNIHQDIYDIVLNEDWVIQGAAQLFSVWLDLKPGNFKLVTLLRNLNLGDKKEKQFTFAVPDSGQVVFTNMVIAQNDHLRFSPASFTQLTLDLKSCVFVLDTTAECDSIVLNAHYPEGISRISIPRFSGTEFDIMPLLQQGSLSNLEVRYYTENIISSISWVLYQSYDQYLQRFTLKEQVQQIRYIANQNEWRTISRLADKDLDSAVEYFWSRHDNSPGSLKNDLRELFYERVLKADELFTIHKKLPGWRSDRGKIYIKMGPPDEIVSDSFPIGQHPYIIWYYYRQNRIYRFEDKRGYGDYSLMEGFYEN
jgi:GWxTD domain-containing protein